MKAQQGAACFIMHQFLPELLQSAALAAPSAVLHRVWDVFPPPKRNTRLVEKRPVHKQGVVGLGELTGEEGEETAHL